jgi:hypothetical protein
MWLFSKVKNFIQINFAFFSILNYWTQINKKRIQQVLNSQQKLWAYFSLIPLFFVFFEKVKASNPYNKKRSFFKVKPLINIPKRVKSKKTRKCIDRHNCIFFVPSHLNINKKKRRAFFFLYTS